MGTIWDAPNQQVVRVDESPPWEEGDGGTPGAEPIRTEHAGDELNPLDAMTKAELLDHAAANNIDANDSMTKAEIRTAIDEAAG